MTTSSWFSYGFGGWLPAYSFSYGVRGMAPNTYCSLGFGEMAPASYLLPHTSCLLPPTSYLLPPTPCLLPTTCYLRIATTTSGRYAPVKFHTFHQERGWGGWWFFLSTLTQLQLLLPPASCFLPPACYPMPPTSYLPSDLLPPTSCRRPTAYKLTRRLLAY